MMNTTTTIDKATNNQKAFNYAVYMMLGSYFKQMEAVSECYVQKLYLYYVENKREHQYSFEDIAIRFVEREAAPYDEQLPEEIWQERVLVSFFARDGRNYVAFQGARYTLVVQNDYREARTKLQYQLYEDTPAIER